MSFRLESEGSQIKPLESVSPLPTGYLVWRGIRGGWFRIWCREPPDGDGAKKLVTGSKPVRSVPGQNNHADSQFGQMMEGRCLPTLLPK